MIQIKCDRCLNVLCTSDSINQIGVHGPQYINISIHVGDGKYVRRSLCRDCLYLFFKNFLEENPDDVLYDNEKEDKDNDTCRNT